MEAPRSADPADTASSRPSPPRRASLADEVGPDMLAAVLGAPTPGRFGRGLKGGKHSCLARETIATMFTGGPDPGEIIRAVAAADAADAFDPFALHRRLIREWADQTCSDPFVERCLAAAAEHRADFTRAVDAASEQLDDLRIKYAIEKRGAATVALERGPGGRLQVVATQAWADLAKAFPADAKEIHANVAVAELAAGRVRRAAKDVNRELSLFFTELVPTLFVLLEQLPKRRLRERLGRVRLTPALAAAMAETARTTDFVADPTRKLGVRRAPLPKRLRLLAALPEHVEVHELIAARRVQQAQTIEAGPPAPPTEAE